MIKYKLINDQYGDVQIVHNKHKNIYIPLDEANTDYQEYLEWLAEGNTPEEAE